jgi:hypothetical protein
LSHPDHIFKAEIKVRDTAKADYGAREVAYRDYTDQPTMVD